MERFGEDLQLPFPLELAPLDAGTWRVADRRFDDGDPRRILGYLTENTGEYEMLWMRPRIGVRHLYPSIEDAVRGITTRLIVPGRR